MSRTTLVTPVCPILRDNGTVIDIEEDLMKDGFIKVAAITPNVRVADVSFNVASIVDRVRDVCENEGAKVVVCPELCVTGYTCGDLFFQNTLIRSRCPRACASPTAPTPRASPLPSGTSST